MARVVVPFPAAINWAHLEAAGLVACLVARPGSMLDLVLNAAGTRNGTADPSRPNVAGTLDAYFDGSGDGYAWGSTLGTFPTGAFTIAWECQLDNLTVTSPQVMGWYRNDATFGPARLVYTSPTDTISLARGSSEVVAFSRPSALSYTERHWGVWIFRGGTFTTTANHTLVINGVALAAGTAPTFGARTDRTEIGLSSSAGVNDLAGGVRQLRLYDHAWSEAQAYAWANRRDDALYVPRARRVFAFDAGGAVDLVVSDGAHAHAADALTLTQNHVLVVADGAHGHTVDVLTLTQVHELLVDAASHGHTAEAITLAAGASLIIADGLHSHAAEALTLTQVHILIVADGAHAHSAEAVTLSSGASLSIADADHAHAAEAITLSAAYQLVIADAVHTALAESPALTQVHQLVVSDALHAHFAQQVAFGNVLTTSDERVLIVPAQNRILIVAKSERQLH